VTTKPDPHREFHVHRRTHHALERHHLPDVAAIHEARERFREALRAEPDGLELEARLAHREAALNVFDRDVAAALGEPR
jgi:hypothetical protein